MKKNLSFVVLSILASSVTATTSGAGQRPTSELSDKSAIIQLMLEASDIEAEGLRVSKDLIKQRKEILKGLLKDRITTLQRIEFRAKSDTQLHADLLARRLELHESFKGVRAELDRAEAALTDSQKRLEIIQKYKTDSASDKANEALAKDQRDRCKREVGAIGKRLEMVWSNIELTESKLQRIPAEITILNYLASDRPLIDFLTQGLADLRPLAKRGSVSVFDEIIREAPEVSQAREKAFEVPGGRNGTDVFKPLDRRVIFGLAPIASSAAPIPVRSVQQ